MAWAKIDDRFFSHPKVRNAGAMPTLLYLASLTYSNEHLTEGFISDNVLPLIAVLAFQDVANVWQNASTLLDVSLWEKVEGGYKIHDYHEYNATKAEVQATRQAKAEAGRKGGFKKAEVMAAENKPNTDIPSKTPSKSLANGWQKSSNIPYQSPTNPLNTTTGGGGENSARNSEIFTAYENNFGMITPITADQIKATITEFSNDWIMAAIGEAMKNNVRKWSYVEAVLDRWKVDGFQSKPARGQPTPSNGNGKRKRTTSDVVAEAMAEWEAERAAKEQEI
jgi:DnaD/phage-associated family protein